MEKIEMIKFDENGQGFIDWESLEVITNVEFVEDIKKYMDCVEEFSPMITLVKNRENVVSVVVHVQSLGRFAYFDFLKASGYITVRLIWDTEIDEIVKSLGGEIKWGK